MTGHASYAQRTIRDLRRRFVRRRWIPLTLFALFVVAAFAGLAWYESIFNRWFHSELVTGFILGAGVATAVALVVTLLGLDGSRTYREGLEAEGWTATELNRRRKQGWSVFNDLEFEGRNIDHVLIGPKGAIAIETKRRNAVWTLTTTSIEDARHNRAFWAGGTVAQATRQARTLRSLLFAGGVRTDVLPVIVLWGRDITGEPATTIDGVLVGLGNAIEEWFDRIESSPLSAEQIELACRALDRFKAGEGVRRPPLEPVPAGALTPGQIPEQSTATSAAG